VRKWLILIHRYLGIALSLVFLMWFMSGIAMIYARDMPRLTPEARLERRPAVDVSRIRVTPAEAASRVDLDQSSGRVALLTVLDRPAYRFSGRRPVTIFADTGDRMRELHERDILRVASRFLNLPETSLRHAGILASADQWTIALRGQLPLHKVTVDDPARTELYVSPRSGEVAVLTTRASRALAWIAAIPHWLYFAPLRLNDAVWRQVVLWLSGLAVVSALIGLVLGVIQFRWSRSFRFSRLTSSIPYAGWMRWHYLTGIVFGVFTVTWAFSGMLSMEPWFWASRGGSGEGIYGALAGGPVDLAAYPGFDAAEWHRELPGRTIKEIDFAWIQGNPYYVVLGSTRKPELVSADPLRLQREPFPVESLMARVREGNPDVPIVSSEVLSSYDSYYYSQDRSAPLPVLRVQFGDPDATWFYIDPAMSQAVASFTRRQRLQRWIYHGFHSLDFGFWYASRPFWDIGIITLSLGGTMLSVIGVVIGYKRIRKHL
jgi:hypothetical protein